MEIADIKIPTELLQQVSAEQAWEYGIVPKQRTGEGIEFFSSTTTQEHVDELEVLFGGGISFSLLPDDDLRYLLGKYYRRGKNKEQRENISFSNDFFDRIVYEAFTMNCSDIHFESFEKSARVRFRIDGKLLEKYVVGKTDYVPLVNQIKIRANLDIAEKRLPQDGRVLYSSRGTEFDIRVSIVPTMYGEKVVLRLLNKDSATIDDLSGIGFSAGQLEDYLLGVKRTNGIVLISGPTGSGKTTTLYSTLKYLNSVTSNILTIEDPIEYTLEGINQVQLREDIGLTFPKALRAFLRQDPDIIMLGEIRDSDTAEIAIRAALTGHLVLSTIHTNSAWGTVSRIIDMGVEPFLLSNVLNLSVAQRLIRLLCPHCKKKSEVDAGELPHVLVDKIKAHETFTGVGCEACYYTGYKGRKAIFETIYIDSDFRKAIMDNTSEVENLKKGKGVGSLVDNALACLYSGETSLEEIMPILLENIEVT